MKKATDGLITPRTEIQQSNTCLADMKHHYIFCLQVQKGLDGVSRMPGHTSAEIWEKLRNAQTYSFIENFCITPFLHPTPFIVFWKLCAMRAHFSETFTELWKQIAYFIFAKNWFFLGILSSFHLKRLVHAFFDLFIIFHTPCFYPLFRNCLFYTFGNKVLVNIMGFICERSQRNRFQKAFGFWGKTWSKNAIKPIS